MEKNNRRKIFYLRVVNELIKDKEANILVCGGGYLDKSIFEELEFKYVTISNLDSRIDEGEFEPFLWKYENAENLSFADNSFDFVVIHAAIHHASSPHKVLLEMYRVAKKGVLAFESRDSALIRILEKYNFTQTYETAAVFFNECKYGGVNNTEIPNFIYRWTEREIEKTIRSYSPYYKHTFIYKYGYDLPCTPQSERKGLIKKMFINLFRPFYTIFIKLFPKQQNLFAFYIEKPNNNSLFPWLKINTKLSKITFNQEWGENKYKKNGT
jgi:SAM-dependent methyltransferase